MLLTEFRQKNPQYDDMDDESLSRGIYNKYYSDLDYGEFSKSIGYEAPASDAANEIVNAFQGVVNQGIQNPLVDNKQSVVDYQRPPEPETLNVLGTEVKTGDQFPTISGNEDVLRDIAEPGWRENQFIENYDAIAPGKRKPGGMYPSEPKSELRTALEGMFGARGDVTPESNAVDNVKAIGEMNAPKGTTGREYIESAGPAEGVLTRGLKDVASGGVSTAEGMLGFVSRMTDSNGMRVAQDIMSGKARELMAADPKFLDELAAGFGSTGTFFVPGLGIMKGAQAVSKVSPRMAAWLGSGASAGMEAATESGAVYTELRDQGLSHKEAAQKADNVFWQNAALVSVTNKYGLFNENGGQAARRSLSAVNEGVLQEAPQQAISNVATGKDWDEGVGKSALIGSIVGGALGGNTSSNDNKSIDNQKSDKPVSKVDESPAEQIANILKASVKQPQQQSPYANNNMASNVVELFKQQKQTKQDNETSKPEEMAKPAETAVVRQNTEQKEPEIQQKPSKLPELLKLQSELQQNGYENTEELNTKLSDIKALADEVAYSEESGDREAYNKSTQVKKWAVEFGHDVNKNDKEKETNAVHKIAKQDNLDFESSSLPNERTSGNKNKDKFESFLDKTAKRILMEEQGQDILFNLEEEGASPESVSKEFWVDVYPNLNNKMKTKFEKNLNSLSGWEPGSVIAFNGQTGEKTIGKTWEELADALGKDLPGKIEHLEGTERGYVALMSWATQKLREQNNQEESSTLPVAESQALGTSEPSDTGVASSRESAAPDTNNKDSKIQDFGEKLGGARKDTSRKGTGAGRTVKDPRKGWQRRYDVSEVAAEASLMETAVNGELSDTGNKGKFTVYDKRKSEHLRSNYKKRYFNTREEAEEAIPLHEVSRNHRVQSADKKGEYEIVRIVTDRKRPVVKGGFESREEAMEYMAKNAVDIIETKTRFDDSIHPALKEAIRSGEARREDDANVGADDFNEIFGFRGVEFGKWNNSEERQHILNQAYDAFLDLAEMLNVPPKAISLNGDLGVGFGSRGHGLTGAKAHYEMNYGVINLTKIKGAGSLAHEWMHALDHYLGREGGKAKAERITKSNGDKVFDASKSPSGNFVSHGFGYQDKTREELKNAFDSVMDTITKRTQEYKEDVSSRERFENGRKEDLHKRLDKFRTDLETDYTGESYQPYRGKKNNAPATKEQLKEADKIIADIKAGEYGTEQWVQGKGYGGIHLFESVKKLSDLYKTTRGRQGYSKAQGRLQGVIVNIQAAISSEKTAAEYLAEAQKQKVKTRKVASEFYSEAYFMDKGSRANYWSTQHELMARAFESYIYDKLKTIDARNDFLSYEKHNDLPEYKMFNVKPYPEGKEREAINGKFKDLFEVFQTKETKNGTALFSKEKAEPKVDKEVVELWKQFVMDDEMFQQPKSNAKTIKEITAEISPDIQVENYDYGIKRAGLKHEWRLVMPDKSVAFVRENTDGTIELNVARLKSGSGRGTAIYNIVSTFAHNNGKVFIGDRDGLSEDAYFRRTENMLSSALKFGTTKHLRPHPKQKIDWIQGDHEGNMVRLMERSYTNITEAVPLIKDITYDFSENAFVHNGRRVDRLQFDTLAKSAPAKSGRAGIATLKRGALTSTFLQAKSGAERRGILAYLSRQLQDSRRLPGLKDILYSKDKPASSGFSVSEVEKIIAPVILKWGDKSPKVEVVQSISEIPEHILDAEAHGMEKVSAVHYGAEEQIYLVADKLKDKDHILSRLAHEAVGHHSFEQMMGDDLDQVLERVQWLKRSGDKKLTEISDEVFQRYGKLDKTTEAKEIVALVAEKGVSSPLLTKVVELLRKFLRKLGINLKWSKSELDALVVKAAKNLEVNRTKKEKAERKESYKHFSKEDNERYFSREPNEILDDIDEEAQNVPTWDKVKRSLGNSIDHLRPGALKMLTRRHLADIGSSILPTIKTYVLTAEKMDAFRNELVAESSEIAKGWTKWATQKENVKDADAMVNTMHAATIAGVDPAEPYSSIINLGAAKEDIAKQFRFAKSMPGEAGKYIEKVNEIRERVAFEKNREKAYPELKRQWDKLPPKAQEIYKEVRDHYVQRMDQTQQALMDKIDRAELSAKEKEQYKAEMRAQFESVRIEGPYFPLARFGDYWAKVLIPTEWQKKYSIRNKGFTAKDSEQGKWAVMLKETRNAIETFDSKEEAIKWAVEKSTDYEFYMFEKKGHRDNLVKKKENEGLKVKTGHKIDKNRQDAAVSEGFIANVLKVVDKLNLQSNSTHDEIYQLFLNTLPDVSMRKSFIHRQKKEGFTPDALRAFSHHNFHGAYQLSKLKFADVMQTQLENMEEQARDMTGDKADKAAQILNETKKRHDWAMNPMGAGWANNVTQFNFVWYLGATPAAAIVNMTQTAMVAFPSMGAKFGFTKAGKELLNASREFMGNRIEVKDGLFSIEGALKGDELKAYQWLVDTGIIDKTLAHDLAAMSETPSAIYSPKKDKVMGAVSYAFHHAERFNREVTSIATYRLARKKGLSHAVAMQEAYDMVDATHFNYSNANKAAFMQNDIAKVAFIFKQYSLNMIYLLARSTYQSVKGESAAVKKEARRKLGGILFMSYLFVGYNGMPWLPFGVIDLILEMIWDDEDEPFDIEAERRNNFTELLGSTWADVLAIGPVEALTGVGFSDRLALDSLWFRPSGRDLEAKEELQYQALSMLGPTLGILDSAARGVGLMKEGKVYRGIETMLPKSAKDVMKAVRIADEGATTLKGDPIVQDINAFEAFMQFIGFSVGRVNKQYDARSTIKNAENRIKDRRKLLMNKFATSINNGDAAWQKEILKEMAKFSKKNPTNAITVDSIERSLKMRARTSAMTKNGVYLRKNMQHLRNKGRFADE